MTQYSSRSPISAHGLPRVANESCEHLDPIESLMDDVSRALAQARPETPEELAQWMKENS